MCKANDIPSTEQNNSVTAMRNWLIEYGPIFFFLQEFPYNNILPLLKNCPNHTTIPGLLSGCLISSHNRL